MQGFSIANNRLWGVRQEEGGGGGAGGDKISFFFSPFSFIFMCNF